MKRLGEGQFGVVNQVSAEQLEQKFALKTISFNKIDSFHMGENVVNEKRVLQKLRHPFLITLFGSFIDQKAVHFQTELVSGVNMYEMLEQFDLLSNAESQFYTA